MSANRPKPTIEMIHAVLNRQDEVGDHAIGRALVALLKRQTDDEVATECTRHTNERGFNQAHARIGTSMAADYTRYGRLTPRQANWWRRSWGSTGKTHISIYARQLLEDAERKWENSTNS